MHNPFAYCKISGKMANKSNGSSHPTQKGGRPPNPKLSSFLQSLCTQLIDPDPENDLQQINTDFTAITLLTKVVTIV